MYSLLNDSSVFNSLTLTSNPLLITSTAMCPRMFGKDGAHAQFFGRLDVVISAFLLIWRHKVFNGSIFDYKRISIK